MSDRHRAFDQIPMVQWAATFDRLSPAERDGAWRHAAGEAQQYARITAYIGRRQSYQGSHDNAVKAQNRVARAVRKALGYSDPNNPITF